MNKGDFVRIVKPGQHWPRHKTAFRKLGMELPDNERPRPKEGKEGVVLNYEPHEEEYMVVVQTDEGQYLMSSLGLEFLNTNIETYEIY